MQLDIEYLNQGKLENKEAHKLINRMQTSILKNEVALDKIAENFRTLREYALEEKLPRLVKTCRLSYQHIEEHNAFLIPIPSDEPIDEDHDLVQDQADLAANTEAQYESLDYLLSLVSDSTNKLNAEELKEYIEAFENF